MHGPSSDTSRCLPSAVYNLHLSLTGSRGIDHVSNQAASVALINCARVRSCWRGINWPLGGLGTLRSSVSTLKVMARLLLLLMTCSILPISHSECLSRIRDSSAHHTLYSEYKLCGGVLVGKEGKESSSEQHPRHLAIPVQDVPSLLVILSFFFFFFFFCPIGKGSLYSAHSIMGGRNSALTIHPRIAYGDAKYTG